MLGEYLGVGVHLGLSIGLIGLLFVARAFLAPSSRPSEPDPDPDGAQAGDEQSAGAPPSKLSVPFHRVALLATVVVAQVAWLALAAPGLRSLGAPGLVAMALFAVPLVVAIAFAWARGVFDC